MLKINNFIFMGLFLICLSACGTSEIGDSSLEHFLNSDQSKEVEATLLLANNCSGEHYSKLKSISRVRCIDKFGVHAGDEPYLDGDAPGTNYILYIKVGNRLYRHTQSYVRNGHLEFPSVLPANTRLEDISRTGLGLDDFSITGFAFMLYTVELNFFMAKSPAQTLDRQLYLNSIRGYALLARIVSV